MNTNLNLETVSCSNFSNKDVNFKNKDIRSNNFYNNF